MAWKLRGQEGLERRYRVPDISWLKPPRRTLRRTMLVYTRRSHAWRFVSPSRLAVFLCFGWHRPTSCRFLFPGPRVLRSPPSFFPYLFFFFFSLARGYENKKNEDIVFGDVSQAKSGIICWGHNL